MVILENNNILSRKMAGILLAKEHKYFIISDNPKKNKINITIVRVYHQIKNNQFSDIVSMIKVTQKDM